MSALSPENGHYRQGTPCPLMPHAEVARLIQAPQRCKRKVWRAAGALLIRPNNVGTGSDPDVPPQITVKVLGYFGET